MEEFEVTGASFDEKNGLWTVNAASVRNAPSRYPILRAFTVEHGISHEWGGELNQ
jgi:hypothetical protein